MIQEPILRIKKDMLSIIEYSYAISFHLPKKIKQLTFFQDI